MRRRRREKEPSGHNVRVIDLRLQHCLGELRLRVKEDQLSLPPASLPPGLLLCRRSHLDVGRQKEENIRPPCIMCLHVITLRFDDG